MDNDTMAGIITAIIMIPIFLVGVYYLGLFANYMTNDSTCDRYSEEYEYITKLEKLDGGGYACKLLMEDGTWVRASDFNIADVKEPAIKRS